MYRSHIAIVSTHHCHDKYFTIQSSDERPCPQQTTQNADPAYATVPEAATILGVSPSTIWRWIASGELPAYRVGHRFMRVRRSELSAIIRPAHPLERASSENKPGAPEHPQPEPDDLWAGSDPKVVRQALREFAGTITEEEGAARIKALYEAREAGTRPSTRPQSRTCVMPIGSSRCRSAGSIPSRR
ncbi:MAG: helix-turn-helix domain-containing protein [Dehalococcoidia bacterium]